MTVRRLLSEIAQERFVPTPPDDNPHMTEADLQRMHPAADGRRHHDLHQGKWPTGPEGTHERYGELRWRLAKYVASLRAQVAKYEAAGPHGCWGYAEGDYHGEHDAYREVADALDAILKGPA